VIGRSRVKVTSEQEQEQATMPGVAALGMAQSTIEGRDTRRKIFSEFLVDQNRVDSSWPINFDMLTEEQANDITLFERYAFWLTYTSESSRGATYALGTRRNYLRGIAQQLLHCFPKAGSNLSKLEKGRESSNRWMSRIVGNLTRLAIQRAANEGEKVGRYHLDLKCRMSLCCFLKIMSQICAGASSLYLTQLRPIVSSLTLADSADSHFRKLVILQAFMACGRCGEVATCAWSHITWNPALNIPIINWYDLKTSKMKLVAIVTAKESWETDLYIAYGDAAASGQFNIGGVSADSSDGEGRVLFPQLFKIDSSTTKISKFIQDMVPKSGSSFEKFAVHELNESDYSSHSLRHGAIETMEANGVHKGNIADLIGHTQGSGLSQISSSFESTYHRISPSSVALGKKVFLYFHLQHLKT